jgi:hypothetical protein
VAGKAPFTRRPLLVAAGRAVLHHDLAPFQRGEVRRVERIFGLWQWPVRRHRSLSVVQDDDRAVTHVAVAGHETDVRVAHLRLARFAPELAHGLDDVVHGDDMSL